MAHMIRPQIKTGVRRSPPSLAPLSSLGIMAAFSAGELPTRGKHDCLATELHPYAVAWKRRKLLCPLKLRNSQGRTLIVHLGSCDPAL